MPFSADSVCARIPPNQNLVHDPNVPGAHDVYPTVEYSHFLVHMEGGNFPSTIINITQTQKQGVWGLINIGVKCRALLIGRMWLQSL